MACRAIPIIALPQVRAIYILCLCRLFVVYVVKEVASLWGLGQQEECKTATDTISCCTCI